MIVPNIHLLIFFFICNQCKSFRSPRLIYFCFALIFPLKGSTGGLLRLMFFSIYLFCALKKGEQITRTKQFIQEQNQQQESHVKFQSYCLVDAGVRTKAP